MASPTSPVDPLKLPVGVVVLLKLKSEEGLEGFIADFAPLHAYVNNRESNTLLYEAHVRNDDPLGVVIYEKYMTKPDLTETHNSSEEFKTFLAKLTAPAPYCANVEVITTTSINDDRLLMATAGHRLSAKGDGVLVFCGARAGKNPANIEAGTSVGAAIAKRGRTLCYGGGTLGIMGAVVKGALAGGARIRSTIPRAFCTDDMSGEMLGEVTYTHTMSHRKSIMFNSSNTIVCLPGGLGTFDELLEALTLMQLNAYVPKIGLLNVGGFFEPFLALLRHLIAEGYVEENIFDFFLVENSGDGEALLARLEAFNPGQVTNIQWSSPAI